ncbi:hypothetical protein ACW7BJ_32605 [Azospirillum argentinense]
MLGLLHRSGRQGAVARPVAPIEVHRQPDGFALEWQRHVKALRRAHAEFGPGFVADLKAAGLLDRCLVMTSEQASGPLVVRFVGHPTIGVFGREWARRQIGKPLEADPFWECTAPMAAVYEEAASADPVFNRCLLAGVLRDPLPFCHMVVGWRDPLGRRAIVSAIDV